MKKICFIIMTLIGCLMLKAEPKAFNESQTQLRDSIAEFLTEEGFRPQIVESGDIMVKMMGDIYWIQVSTKDSVPMYICFNKTIAYNDLLTRNVADTLLNTLQEERGIKTRLYDAGVVFMAEMYLDNAHPFISKFYGFIDAFDRLEKMCTSFRPSELLLRIDAGPKPEENSIPADVE
ncbi:MAG: hypothetical protein IJC40_04595 [Muribaculaceae bacterium]|nr:hypothetical protein [Muribaculaceae bacterium]